MPPKSTNSRSLDQLQDIDTKLIAFYLPQYHPFAENSKWWGPGFTEWTNVAKAKPNFLSHYQPHVPRDLGFYDLRLPKVMEEQADLARKFGIGGFCFYYYWFAGRRVLETPLNNWLASDIDFPFCICWANENWTKRWDGGSGEVLLEQAHSEDDFKAFFESVLPILKDPRYIRVDGKPVLNVYRPTLFPDPKAVCNLWRKQAIEAGLPGLHLCTVQFYGIDDPREFGFDAAIEFPPHKFVGGDNIAIYSNVLNPAFNGHVIDYRKIILQSLKREDTPYLVYRGVMPSWDNTARRQNDPFIIHHSSPELFHYWLCRIVAWTRQRRPADQRIVYINAWNEWGEGCHLEPDLKYGTRFLEACLAALLGRKSEVDLKNAITDFSSGFEIIAPIEPFTKPVDLAPYESANEQYNHIVSNPIPKRPFVSSASSFVRQHVPALHRPARFGYYILKRIIRS